MGKVVSTLPSLPLSMQLFEGITISFEDIAERVTSSDDISARIHITDNDDGSGTGESATGWYQFEFDSFGSDISATTTIRRATQYGEGVCAMQFSGLHAQGAIGTLTVPSGVTTHFYTCVLDKIEFLW